MANYYATCKTNKFRVTDEERYRILSSGLCAEDLSEREFPGNGHSFAAYDAPFWQDPHGELEDGFDTFVSELQKILPEGEAFIYLESGCEKLRYVGGGYIVATKDEIRRGEINSLSEEIAWEMTHSAEELRRRDRCRDCMALVADEDCEWICDEKNLPCHKIEACPEGLSVETSREPKETAKWFVKSIELDKILFLFNHLYTLLYEDKLPESFELIEACETWMKENPERLAELAEARGDLFTSDREINALALALNLEVKEV